jgi:hypothetical protein
VLRGEKEENAMSHHRSEQRVPQSGARTLLLAETVRATTGTAERADEGGSGELRLSTFWRLFGGTLLSVATLVIITLCQQFSTGLNDLRREILRLNQAQGELVKADDFKSRTRALWEWLKELEATRAALTGLQEKSALLQERLRAAEKENSTLAHEVRALQEAEAGAERAKLVGERKRLHEQRGAPGRQEPTSVIATSSAYHEDPGP